MSETIIDYDKANKYLPESVRAFIGAVNRISSVNLDTFFAMYSGIEQLAVFNNKTAAEFASGFVPSLNYRYLRSGVAPRLLKILVSKTVGRVYYQSEMPEEELEKQFNKDYFSDILAKSFEEAAKTGRSVIAVYKAENSPEISLLTYNLFRHRVEFDSQKNIRKAELFLSNHSGEVAGSEFTVCERRYYKTDREGNKKPYQKFVVLKSIYTMESKKDAKNSEIENPIDIPPYIIQKYPGIKFNVEQELVFNDLGVYDIKYTEVNSKFPDSDIPEAMFVDAVDNALTIDTSITGKEVEKEIGRGQILIPEFGKMNGIGYQTQETLGMNTLRTVGLSQYKNPVVMPYPSMKMDDSKPSNIQFDIRSEQWINQIDNDTARLCANVGISVLDYDPRLLVSGQRTDDEINAMTDITANTVNNFRNINQRKVNQLLGCIVEALGLEKPVAIRWSMASILNPTKNTDLVIKQLEKGLISRKEAIRRANPDLSNEEVDQMIKDINQEYQEQEVATQFNNF
jgi:hypothetical protein